MVFSVDVAVVLVDAPCCHSCCYCVPLRISFKFKKNFHAPKIWVLLAVAFIGQLANADFQQLGTQCSILMDGLQNVDWTQVAFTVGGEDAVGEDTLEDSAQINVAFQIAGQLCSSMASQMSPPAEQQPAPMCENVLSIPSLPAFMLANLDAGHYHTVARNAVDFFGRIQQGDWSVQSDHVATCREEHSCSELVTEDACNSHTSFGVPDCYWYRAWSSAANGINSTCFARSYSEDNSMCRDVGLDCSAESVNPTSYHEATSQMDQPACADGWEPYAEEWSLPNFSCRQYETWCEDMAEEHGTVVERDVSDVLDHGVAAVARSVAQLFAAALPASGVLPPLGMAGAHGTPPTGFDLVSFAADAVSSESWAKVSEACATTATALMEVDWDNVVRQYHYGEEDSEGFEDYEGGLESYVESYESTPFEAAQDAEGAIKIRMGLDVMLHTCQELSRLLQ
eukprot:SAG31_NODE_5404_length_2556_cov_1.703704_2_plen_453_part_00